MYVNCDNEGDIVRYDDTNPIDIERYGREMLGMSFRDIFERAVAEGNPLVTDKKYMAIHADKNFKGGMGNLVEECWFEYKANSNPEPDFEKAGVELKVTPYKAVKKGFSAKERLVLTMIDYIDVYKEKDLLTSHLWKKLGCILLAWYLHKDGQNDIDSTVDFVQLFTPPAEDLEIIKQERFFVKVFLMGVPVLTMTLVVISMTDLILLRRVNRWKSYQGTYIYI